MARHQSFLCPNCPPCPATHSATQQQTACQTPWPTAARRSCERGSHGCPPAGVALLSQLSQQARPSWRPRRQCAGKAGWGTPAELPPPGQHPHLQGIDRSVLTASRLHSLVQRMQMLHCCDRVPSRRASYGCSVGSAQGQRGNVHPHDGLSQVSTYTCRQCRCQVHHQRGPGLQGVEYAAGRQHAVKIMQTRLHDADRSACNAHTPRHLSNPLPFLEAEIGNTNTRLSW